MEWLSTWHQYIRDLDVSEDLDLTETDYRDSLARANLPHLTSLLKNDAVIELLTEAYIALQATMCWAKARAIIRNFIVDACWICKVTENGQAPSMLKHTLDRGDQKKDLLNLSKAAAKLAKQITALAPSTLGPDSYPYLEERLQAGNPVGHIFTRKKSWQSYASKQPVRRLSELLTCFASDVAEEAAMLGIAIEKKRQKGGRQAGLHFAMDSLTSASKSLSVEVSKPPNFALVNCILVTLIDPADGFDPSTARKRYSAAQRRKTIG